MKSLENQQIDQITTKINYYFNQATELESENSFYFNNKGLWLKVIGKYQEASDCYEKAIELKPKN